MQTFTAIIVAAALLATVSGSPIQVRSTCGSAPAGTGSQEPISQPTGIATAASCQEQCDANASCQSFVFGMVNSVDECMLYSVAAASVPAQPSTNLVVYDKACSSVPAIVPTTSNPTGAATGSSSSSGTSSNTGSNSNTGSTQSGANGPKLAVRDTCGAAPSATGAETPLSQLTGISTASACQAQCDADSSCESFVFGMVNSVDECILYSVAASSVPAQSSANLIVYDKACLSVPAVVPTASNPTGAATGSNTSSGTGSETGPASNTGSNGAIDSSLTA